MEFLVKVNESKEYSYAHDEGATIIWNLSLSEQLFNTIINKGGKQALEYICEFSANEEAKSIAKSALHTIFSEKPKANNTLSKKCQIMISYNWDHKTLVEKIVEELEKDSLFNVWLDTRKMSGNIIEAMSKAVDESHVVLVCVSEKYKLSKNCALEAQYAYQQDKEIVPIVFERNALKGWLGALIGTKLYFDFSDPKFFQQTITNLSKELKSKYSAISHSSPPPPVPIESLQEKRFNEIKEWSVTQVVEWLEKTVGLQKQYQQIFIEHEFNGETLFLLLSDVSSKEKFKKLKTKIIILQFLKNHLGIEKVGHQLLIFDACSSLFLE